MGGKNIQRWHKGRNGIHPLYSVINGFWIDETGNLEIVIRYLPQDWFELGLKISELTFIGCIAYLFYDWRKVINGLKFPLQLS